VKSFLDHGGFHDLPVDLVARLRKEQGFIELAAEIRPWNHEIREHSRNGAHLERSEELKQHEIIGHRN
jgi:hypothetical protein